ncbi:cysteine-rich receptor-like protein kinase 46 [Arachis duranensis]|uniref:Cysteine-rich receptor-like protein kinase 46 n=1 Tax=Arachis duranensis TaxID=130453 RepID=A0A6P4DNZ4_ARADU|nr:cysteine-rich receptor-like protein kinase 46 [Arachis duranensis]
MANKFLPLITTTILIILSSLCGLHCEYDRSLKGDIIHRLCSYTNMTDQYLFLKYQKNYWNMVNEMKNDMRRSKFSVREVGDPPYRIYLFSQCRSDLSASECVYCFKSLQSVFSSCMPAKGARTYSSDGCFMRYDNYSFFQESVTPYYLRGCSDAKAKDEKGFVGLAVNVINKMSFEAPKKGGYTAIEGRRHGSNLVIYGAATCWKTLSQDMCSACLSNAASTAISCLPSTQVHAINTGCILRYADYDFIIIDLKNKESDILMKCTAIILAAIAVCSVLIIVAHYGTKNVDKLWGIPILRTGLEMTPGRVKLSSWFMQFEYSTLERATNVFNEFHKLGEGGYGEVYKGTLQDGREIAIKRFFLSGKQGKQEVYNEIDVYGKAQHKNLVRFLGCCFTSTESYLVFEFLANKSLNCILFDPEKKKQLDWPKRHGIILGVADGLEHLHNNSEGPIIHRDIKAGNILLDLKYRPKISDFGLAKLKSYDSTSIVGTLGYMAPEYLAGCSITEKVDVYSFGILVLEIISGVENAKFESTEETFETLVSHAWKHFKSNTTSKIIDESMENQDLEEITRVIHVGLLCTQELPYLRPSMTEVVAMLRQKDVVMPLPSKPPFTVDSFEFPQEIESSWESKGLDNSELTVPLNFGERSV